jgi:hypothetical protein
MSENLINLEIKYYDMSSESQNMKTAETAVVGNGSTNMHVARI